MDIISGFLISKITILQFLVIQLLKIDLTSRALN